jgi:hypothetical protein
MALQLGMTQHVANVAWGGGTVFVFFGYKEQTDDPNTTPGNGFVYCVKIKGKNSDPEIHKVTMPRGFETNGGGCASYKKVGENKDAGEKGEATFVIAGYEVVFVTTGFEDHGMIYLSNDGLNWKKVLEIVPQGVGGEPGAEGGIPIGMVWSPADESFFSAVTYARLQDDGPHYFEQIRKSSKGDSWSTITDVDTTDYARGPSGGGAHPRDYVAIFPATYCDQNDCFDDYHNHVPDGVMIYDDKRKVTMKPKFPPTTSYADGAQWTFITDQGSLYGSSIVYIKIETEDDTEEFSTSIPGLAIVTCVGGANGIWMAGGFIKSGFSEAEAGGGSVAVSTDDGHTWTTVMNTPRPIMTLAAAPAGDIAK